MLEVFRQAGIPAHSWTPAIRGYEVVTIALLQVLTIPSRTYMAAILRAPWFGVTDEELAQSV